MAIYTRANLRGRAPGAFVVSRHLSIVTALLLVFTASLIAEQGQGVIRLEQQPRNEREIERSAVNFAGRWRPAGSTGLTRVIGTVIDIRQMPVPNARIQLRNLDTGNVEMTVDSGVAGDYAFEVEDTGTYVVEMVMVDGYVVALSSAGAVRRYETLNTIVQLPGRWDFASRSLISPQNMTSFFGMSAQTTMTAQTLQIAVEQEVRPTNAGTPVSPF